MFAGVYNEYIIKNVAGQEVDIMLQNVYMYLDSILCNICILLYRQELVSSFTPVSLATIWQFFVICIIINNSMVGIVTSLFLKNLNSILKAFASALELVFTAIFSFILLGFPLHWNTIIAVAVVCAAVLMYAKNPLKTQQLLLPSSVNNSPSHDPLLCENQTNVVILPK